MSAPGIVTDLEDRLNISHETRQRFERVALTAFLILIVIYVAIALAGVLWPPPGKGALDYGATIVSRAIAIKDMVVNTLYALLGGLGISMGRGHMDARISNGGTP